MKTDLEVENCLRNLGLSWITIAEAMSDDNYNKTIILLSENPQITKDEFLKAMRIEETD